MADDLRSLLERHRFLDGALSSYGRVLTTTDFEQLSRERDRVFLELVHHASSNPQVTLAQIRLIVSSLADLASPTAEAERLRDACLSAAERLVSQIEMHTRREGQKLAGVASRENALQYIDWLPDRASVVGRDYGVVFTNRSNARFHRRDQADFNGRPMASVVGKACFEQLSKPNLDACFAGRDLAHVARHDAGDQAFIYAVTYTPIRNAKGKVEKALIVARDVTALGVEADVIWPAPDAA